MTDKGRRHFYGHRLHDKQPEQRHYLQSCVRPDVWAVIQQLVTDHDLSISGAAHHLMRLGAGLSPLHPFTSDDN